MIVPIPLNSIQRITFYKRDQLTDDLICCDISNGDHCWTYHEELTEWDQLIGELKALPGFAEDWQAHVVQPPFSTSEFVAFERTAV